MRDRFIRYRKNPARALNIPAVSPSNASMPQLAPIVIGELGSPGQTGHAHVRRGVMSKIAISAVAERMNVWAMAYPMIAR